MKNKTRLSLSKEELIWHYSPVVLFLPAGIYSLLKTIVCNRYDDFDYFPLVLLLASVLLFWIQKRRLRFKLINKRVTEKQFLSAFNKTKVELKWEMIYFEVNFIQAYTLPELSSSWGELITIKRYENGDVYINSICDPKGFFVSLFSYGRNKKNVLTFKKNLKGG